MAFFPILFQLPVSVDNLIGVTGEFGSGKTLFMLELAFHLAESYQKHVVVNFPLNHSAVRTYCRSRGYRWFAANGRIIEVDLAKVGITEIFKRKGTIIIFDEGGVLINSRNWAKHGMDFLSPLFQVRHDDIHLIVGFQFVDQVDKQLRECFQSWLVCKSLRRRDNALRGPRMYARYVYFYNREKFEKLEFDVKAKANAFRPWLAAQYVCFSILPLNWFINECALLFKILFWYAHNFKKPEVLARGFKKTLSREDMLFRCYRSIGHRIGQIDNADNAIAEIHRVNRPVFVSDGLAAPNSVRVLKRSKKKLGSVNKNNNSDDFLTS